MAISSLWFQLQLMAELSIFRETTPGFYPQATIPGANQHVSEQILKVLPRSLWSRFESNYGTGHLEIAAIAKGKFILGLAR